MADITIGDAAVTLSDMETIEDELKRAIDEGRSVVSGAHFIDGKLLMPNNYDKPAYIANSLFEIAPHLPATAKRNKSPFTLILSIAVPALGLIGLALLTEKGA